MRLLAILAVVVALSAAAAAQDPAEAYHLRADSQEYEEDVFWRGVGNVRVDYKDIKISCDELELQLKTGDVYAVGSVVLEQGQTTLLADELSYNLDSKTGIFYNASGSMPPYYHFAGREVEKLDETHYRLRQASFSTCEPTDRPPWRFRARKALIEVEGYGRFRGTALQVKGVPLLYLPYMVWPVKRDRAAGLLVPTFGYSSRRGAYLGNSLFLPLGRSYDTTIFLDAYSRGYLGVGSEWRWAPMEGAEGDVTLYAIRNFDIGEQEWKINGSHAQDDFFGFKMLAEIHELSDMDFFQEFERSFDRNTLRSLYSYVYLTRSWGPYALNLRADRRKTYLSSDSEIELSQLPEVELRVRPSRIGRTALYWSLTSSLNSFDVDRGEPLVARYGRADLYPSLSYTLPGPPWLTITPRVAGRATYYTSQYGRNESNRTVFVEEGLERTYAEGGVDIVGPSFSRIFNTPLGPYQKFKHLIEPRFEYAYLSDVGEIESNVPRFDEVDSAMARNRVRVSLSNRLFARPKSGASAQELASLDLYQEYSFTEPLNYSSDRTEVSQRGPLNASLRMTPARSLIFDLRASYDTLFDSLRSTSLSSVVTVAGLSSNLTWYEGFNPQSGDRTSSQLRAALGFRRPGLPYRVDLQLSYDVEKSEFQQQRLVFRYEGSCWSLEAEYRDLRLGLYPSRDYRIIIDFKGIGRMLEVKGGLDDAQQ